MSEKLEALGRALRAFYILEKHIRDLGADLNAETQGSECSEGKEKGNPLNIDYAAIEMRALGLASSSGRYSATKPNSTNPPRYGGYKYPAPQYSATHTTVLAAKPSTGLHRVDETSKEEIHLITGTGQRQRSSLQQAWDRFTRGCEDVTLVSGYGFEIPPQTGYSNLSALLDRLSAKMEVDPEFGFVIGAYRGDPRYVFAKQGLQVLDGDSSFQGTFAPENNQKAIEALNAASDALHLPSTPPGASEGFLVANVGAWLGVL